MRLYQLLKSQFSDQIFSIISVYLNSNYTKQKQRVIAELNTRLSSFNNDNKPSSLHCACERILDDIDISLSFLHREYLWLWLNQAIKNRIYLPNIDLINID